MPLFRSVGTTPSERYLARLCNHTFLSLWSYPNVFRDQGRNAGKGDGKELCDLLVVFGSDVIIFSDKSCEFPDSGDLVIDWCRWYRRSITSSIRQVYGAERWLREAPDHLYIDARCTQRLPFPLSDLGSARFHRVVVALNSADRCRRERGGNGGLAIVPNLVGPCHTDPADPKFRPFAIGQVDPTHGFVHVFDDAALDAVLKNLDTVSDFVGYLRKREALVVSGRLDSAPSEEDLLAAYLRHVDDHGHAFALPPDGSALVIPRDNWTSLASNPRYIAKKLADKPSYVWDSIIEEFTKHTLGATLILDSHTSVAGNERLYRIMAAESRLGCRVLANALRGILLSVPKGQIGMRTTMSNDAPDTGYVFVAMSNMGMPEDQFRLYRRAYLADYCLIVASKCRQFRSVVGLATEAGLGGKKCSHDLVYIDAGEWTEEMEADAQETQKRTGLFVRTTAKHIHDQEYPEVLQMRPLPAPRKQRKTGRNDRCPCGSGMKYKKCCGH